MPRENIELARRAIETLNQRDVPGALSLFSDDVEVDWTRSRGPFKGTYRGHAELKRFWDEYWVTFESLRVEAHDFIDAGSDVVVPNTGHLRGRGGMEVTARSTLVYTVKDGRITRLTMFQEHDEALEAVGVG